MCLRPDTNGAYRIVDATVDPTFLLPDTTNADSVQLPFAFEVMTTLTVPLRPSWRIVDVPDPTFFRRSGLLFSVTTQKTPDLYTRSLYLRVERTRFTSGALEDLIDFVRVVRASAARTARILP